MLFANIRTAIYPKASTVEECGFLKYVECRCRGAFKYTQRKQVDVYEFEG